MSVFRQILVMRGGAIGDFVLTLPAIGAIRRAFPSAHIRLLGHPHISDLAVGRGYADSARNLEDAGFATLFAPAQEHAQTSLSVAHARNPIKELKAFDLIVAFWRDPEGMLAGNLARFCPAKIVVHDPMPPPEPKRHAVDHLCEVLGKIEIHEHNPSPRLFPGQEDLAGADAFLAERRLDPAKTIAVHPGSGGRTKNWPADRFNEIIERITTHTECQVLLTCGPADEEVVKATRGTFAIANNFSLPILAAILSKCRAYLGNDSGITHIAAAVGTPTIAIFGPTDPDVWGPRGESVTIIRGQAPCAPCSREERLACKNRRCLEAVGIDDVWDRIREY
ncbi:MAG: glycosyltransferase family 9 protein [Planctomycetota bacterium]